MLEHELPEAAALASFRRVPVPLAVVDLVGNLLESNLAFDSRIGETTRLQTPLPLPEELLAGSRDAPGQLQLQLQTPDELLEAEAQLLTDEHDLPGWFLISLPDAAPVRMRDPLTGLADRALVLDRVTQALERRKRTGGAVELVVVDLNGFKKVNDTLGHSAGDLVLLEVAARLSSLIRPSDTLARWGGDEFIVLLDDVTTGGGHLVCSRLIETLDRPIEIGSIGNGSLKVTASCGWVEAKDGDEAAPLLHRADLQMYEQKRRYYADRRNPTGLSSRVRTAKGRSDALRLLATDVQARTKLVLEATERARALRQP